MIIRYRTQQYILDVSNKLRSGSVGKSFSCCLQGKSYPVCLGQPCNTHELHKNLMAVGVRSWIVPRKRNLTSLPRCVRAMSSGAMESDKCFRRESTASILSFIGGLVTGKGLKTRYFHTAKAGGNLESDPESTTSEEDLTQQTLIKILLHKNQNQGNYKGIFDIIISPNNLSMA